MAKVKKSAIIAFCELLQSVEAGDDVLLLRSSDGYTATAVQEYNDALTGSSGEDEERTEYQSFTDHLAEIFDQTKERYVPEVVIPNKAQMKNIAKILVQLCSKRDVIFAGE